METNTVVTVTCTARFRIALTQVPELCGIFIYFRSEIKADEQLSGIQFRNWRVVTTLVVAFRYFCGIFVIKDGVFYGKDV